MSNLDVKDTLDIAAVSSGAGAYFGWLPEVAALFAIIWTSIRIFEWVENRFWKKGKSDIHKD